MRRVGFRGYLKMRDTLIALRLLAVLTVICGGIYPLLVTGISGLLFPAQAHGGLVHNARGESVGSALIAQKFSSDRYFWPRPSAADYATVASGASNQGPTSAALKKSFDERRSALKATAGNDVIPADLLFASGSGLDPHISKAAARLQVKRIAGVRKFDAAKTASLFVLIEQMTEESHWGMGGDARLNVLLLNTALDKI